MDLASYFKDSLMGVQKYTDFGLMENKIRVAKTMKRKPAIGLTYR